MPKPPKPFFGSLRRAMLVFHRTYGVMDMEAHVFLDFKAWHVSTGLLYCLFLSTVAEIPRYFFLEKVEGR
jgi:hypothetical protein